MLKVKVIMEDTKKYALDDVVSIRFCYTQGNKSFAQSAKIIQFEPDGFVVSVDQGFLQAADNSIFSVIETGENPSRELRINLELLNLDEENVLMAPANQTTIPQIASDIPIRGDFVFGSGYDVITGRLQKSAVKPFEWKPSDRFDSYEYTRTISDESSYQEFINASISASGTAQNVEISGSLAFTKDVKFSSTSISVISSYQYQTRGYDDTLLSSISLTEEAKEYLDKNGAAKFRRKYGDYFVNSFRRGSIFYAVYTFSSSSMSDLFEFKASVSAELPDIMKAKAHSKIKTEALKNHINSEVYVYMTGCNGVFNEPGEWSPEKIEKALEWFKSNQKPTPVYAQLKHYCIIDNSLDNSIDVSLDAYNKQAELFAEFWLVRAKFNALNNYYKEKYMQQLGSIERKITAAQYEMYENLSLFEKYQKEMTQIHQELRNIEELKRLYGLILEQQKTEPGGGENGDYSGFGEKLYGYKEIMINGKNIVKSKCKNIKADSSFMSYYNESFEFSDPTKIVVGCSIQSNWSNGTNGYWRKESNHILLDHTVKIGIGSALGRGCNWTITYYYIDYNDMRFN